MASTNKTSLGLSNWILSDVPEMNDFNSDNVVINEELVRLFHSNDEVIASKDAAAASAAAAASSAMSALESSKRQPMVNPDGFWMLWDSIAGEYRPTNTQANVMYAAFDINPMTGILTMTTPEGYKGANFRMTETGNLEVTI